MAPVQEYWIGSAPSHWEVVPAHAAYAAKQIKNTGLVERTVLSLSYGRIIVKPKKKLRGLVPESFETYQIVDPGDIIIRTTDLQNDRKSLRVGKVRDRGIITSAYACLRAKPCLSDDYAFAFLNAFDLTKAIYGYGAGLRQNLAFRHIRRMPVLVPPPGEQAAIVKFLGYANGLIQRYIQAKIKLIKLLLEQKKVIIHRAVTRGLNPDVPLKPSGIRWVGDIPRHWEVRRAKAVCEAIIDCKNRTPRYVDGGGYLVVRTTCVRNGRFDPAGGYPTDATDYKIWTARGAPRAGDVFFTREAPAGEACLVPDRDDICMGQRMMYFRPDATLLDARFLLLSLYGPTCATYIELATNGSTVGHLRLGQVYALPLLWCPVSEQREIVEHVHQASRPIDHGVEVARREIALLQEYRTRLTADVVTGKLDVREAAAQLPDSNDGQDVLEPDIDADELGEDGGMEN